MSDPVTATPTDPVVTDPQLTAALHAKAELRGAQKALKLAERQRAEAHAKARELRSYDVPYHETTLAAIPSRSEHRPKAEKELADVRKALEAAEADAAQLDAEVAAAQQRLDELDAQARALAEEARDSKAVAKRRAGAAKELKQAQAALARMNSLHAKATERVAATREAFTNAAKGDDDKALEAAQHHSSLARLAAQDLEEEIARARADVHAAEAALSTVETQARLAELLSEAERQQHDFEAARADEAAAVAALAEARARIQTLQAEAGTINTEAAALMAQLGVPHAANVVIIPAAATPYTFSVPH